ncbi:NAD(P)-dependent dehydrogenase (short-subunit alcohol dehydrogenase family) [Rhizobium brockwellii]
MPNYPTPPFPSQKQPMPGFTAQMDPVPDHGEKSYRGSERLKGKRAIITGGDSGIGRAVAIAYAREGADLLLSYLDEDEDADETKRLVEQAGRKAILVSGDIQDPAHCRQIVETAVKELGGIDILVNNAAHQASFKSIDEISDEEWELTFKVNIHSMFYLTKAAVAHMKPRQRHHQHGFDQFGQSEPDAACLCDDQGRDPEFHRRPCSASGRERHSRQCGGARAHLDAAHPIDTA